MKLISETDPRLFRESPPYIFESEDQASRDQFVAGMVATMKDHLGVGLAAPQVGSNCRMFVIEVDGDHLACFNPYVVSVADENDLSQEGCLSFPGLWMKVKRSAWLVGGYYDQYGNQVERRFDGVAARCFQHELDHLNGITFTGLVSPLVLGMAKKRRNKMRNL